MSTFYSDSKIRLTLLSILLVSSVLANNFLPYGGRFAPALNTAQLAYLPVDADGQMTIDDSSKYVQTSEFHARPMVMSLVLPGAGQAYNRQWWKAALFAGIEAAGIVTWWSLNNSSEDKRIEYEAWADKHWSLNNWYNYGDEVSLILYEDFTEDNNVFKGTHQLTIILEENGKEYFVSSDTLFTIGLAGITGVVRDRDFYENIGKYDQFLGGWDDAYDGNTPLWERTEKDVGDSTEIIYLTKNKEDYLDMRYASNQMAKIASYAVSAIMFNHVISAIEAVYSSQNARREEKRVDTSMGLIYDRNSKYGIGGLAVSVRF